MPLKDYRKSAISLILAPYFVNVQELSDADSFDRIKEWVLRCNEVKELEPSVGYFDELINCCTCTDRLHFRLPTWVTLCFLFLYVWWM